MKNAHNAFGRLIAERLKQLGWSQAELARRADLSPTHIGNLIGGRSTSKSGKPKRLPTETVDKIAVALGVPLTEAREAAGLAGPKPTDSSVMTEIESFLRDLSAEHLNYVLIIVRSIHGAQLAAESLKGKPPALKAHIKNGR